MLAFLCKYRAPVASSLYFGNTLMGGDHSFVPKTRLKVFMINTNVRKLGIPLYNAEIL